jgi:hypothetical protein
VINTLAVDELVIVSVNPKPPGFEVSVRRAGKGGAIHDASTVITADKPDRVEALGPLFGLKAPVTVEPPPNKPPTVEPPPVTRPPVTEPPITNPPIDTRPPDDGKPVDITPPIKPEPTGKPEPMQSDKRPKDRKRLYIAGMAGGGGAAFLGIILWTAASATQGQIDDVKVKTKADLQHLKDLEGRGDSLSNWGNVFFLGGLAVAGVSTYFYVKYRRNKHETRSALITPTVFDHGGGLTLTFGGTR